MIWRLPHPVRGILAFLVVWIGGAALFGFGVGVPEGIVLSFLALIAFVVASRGPKSDSTGSST